MGGLEHPFGVVDRACERALDVAEELRFQQRFGERAAIDRQEWPTRTIAMLVDGACDQLFPGAALADDEHRRVCRRRVRDLLVDRRHGRRSAKQRRRHRVADRGRWRSSRRFVKGSLDQPLELRDVEWLADEVERALAYGFDGLLKLAETGDDDHRRRWSAFAHAAKDVDPVQTSIELEIRDDEIVWLSSGNATELVRDRLWSRRLARAW